MDQNNFYEDEQEVCDNELTSVALTTASVAVFVFSLISLVVVFITRAGLQ